MSASTSARLLRAIRQGELPPDEMQAEVRAFGDTQPGEFFREIVEPLADSFDPAQVEAYEQIMRAWISPAPAAIPVIPEQIDVVYVLSRVTLGADIKIVSPILATMKRRFPKARIVFVANRKSSELFEADGCIEHLIADYPRSGGMVSRLEFAHELRERLEGPNRIVIDPDSRMTQLGLLPVCEPESYFHFPSRLAGGAGGDNLSDLTAKWLVDKFDMAVPAYIAPRLVSMDGSGWSAAVSLGVGENESKRIGGDFEAKLIGALGAEYETVWVDRGVGGDEADRVSAAVAESGVGDRVRFWEGGFAGFASIIARSDVYVGYDSAGQHAAAAASVALISIFAGAPSGRFRSRWSAAGAGPIMQIVADGKDPETVLREFISLLPLD